MKPVHVLALIAGTLILAGLALAPFHATRALFYVVPLILLVCLIGWAGRKFGKA